jgi:hypothetical protein
MSQTQMNDMNPNATLAAVTFLAGFAVSDRFTASLMVSVLLFILGKLIDLFIKPYLEERRAAARAAKRLSEEGATNDAKKV